MHRKILVGDIGSTKSTWLYNSLKVEEIHLSGYNPLAHPVEEGSALFKSLVTQVPGEDVEEIWYYGAGIIDQTIANMVRGQINQEYPSSLVHVASDLAGAALAACGHQPGTVAILGTGSHAAIFDGHKIERQATALGFILGDEGGGSDIGKSLLQAYFYKEMPDVVASEMAARLPNGRSGLLHQLKNSPFPNQYLADFARVAVLFQEHVWVKELVSSRFKLFVKRHVVPLHPPGPVHIVGSIGCIFAGLISHELKMSGFTAGDFIREPAHRLFEIHMEHGQKEK